MWAGLPTPSDAWHVGVRCRRTADRLDVDGSNQSDATGRLAALAAIHAARLTDRRVVTMADLVTLDDAFATIPGAALRKQIRATPPQ